jgi:hypothetical protein
VTKAKTAEQILVEAGIAILGVLGALGCSSPVAGSAMHSSSFLFAGIFTVGLGCSLHPNNQSQCISLEPIWTGQTKNTS